MLIQIVLLGLSLKKIIDPPKIEKSWKNKNNQSKPSPTSLADDIVDGLVEVGVELGFGKPRKTYIQNMARAMTPIVEETPSAATATEKNSTIFKRAGGSEAVSVGDVDDENEIRSAANTSPSPRLCERKKVAKKAPAYGRVISPERLSEPKTGYQRSRSVAFNLLANAKWDDEPIGRKAKPISRKAKAAAATESKAFPDTVTASAEPSSDKSAPAVDAKKKIKIKQIPSGPSGGSGAGSIQAEAHTQDAETATTDNSAVTEMKKSEKKKKEEEAQEETMATPFQ